jgi:hypothetical protein
MDDEWVSPQEAVARLLAHHYPGRKKGNVHAMRLALSGALREGVIGWRSERWSEIYSSDKGATFDLHGGIISSEPDEGYPPEFWQRALAQDDVLWANNTFCSSGDVSLLTAPYVVKRWLESNGEATARWCRYAETAWVHWQQCRNALWDTRWNRWNDGAQRTRKFRLRSKEYQAALITLIGEATRRPAAFRDRGQVLDALRLAFEPFGDIPDEPELRELTKAIISEVTAFDFSEGPAPVA